MRFRIFGLIAAVIIGAAATVIVMGYSPKPSAEIKIEEVIPSKVSGFDKDRHSTSDPASLWVVVNKRNPLPKNYIPDDLIGGKFGFTYSRRLAADLDKMFLAAEKEGVTLTINSGYRSFASQQSIYMDYVTANGYGIADSFSARPGYSEHQTGLALDVHDTAVQTCQFSECYENTLGGEWLARHSYNYGFIVRYTQENSHITGYGAEPWHLRYVGVELASEMHQKNSKSMEEFFSVSGGSYAE